LCYILIMREWMRALMRRRGKRGANDSESTGKIGQEIPVNQPAPLQPMYPEKQSRQRDAHVEHPPELPPDSPVASAGPPEISESPVAVSEEVPPPGEASAQELPDEPVEAPPSAEAAL